MQVATDAASVMDTWLRQGVPSTCGFREVHISAPTKPLKPGASPPDNPAENTRPISVSVVFAKMFELLVSTRMEHWRVRHNLIGPQQAAFMQFQSAEMQVLTLRESLLWRRAQGKGTNVIFVDFKAAYDSVHQKVLWKVLKTMGVPEELIKILEPWYATRVGRIKANGELSDPFAINKGVPQGGPLSTLLWNLLIETLSRQLATLPGVKIEPVAGAGQHPELGLTLTHLLFADDLAILTEPNHEAALAALRMVAEWGAAFGVRVNDGTGKTEAMHFAADIDAANAATVSLPPLTVTTSDGQRLNIRWVREYKYLGAHLQLDLDPTVTLQKRIMLLDATVARFFSNNRAISELAVSTQLQLLNTLAVGAINYLLAVIPVPVSVAQQVDKRILAVGHDIVGLPHNSLNAALRLEIPGMPFHATCVMHQVRLLEYLRLTPLEDCLAARIVRLQMECDPVAHPGRRPAYVPFVRRVRAEEQMIRAAGGRDEAQRAALAAPWTPPNNIREIHPAVAVVRRAVACRTAYDALPSRSGVSTRQLQPPSATAEHKVPSVPAIRSLDALYYGGRHAPAASLGSVPYATSMSIAGPGCGGALLAVSTLNWHHTGPVALLRLGRKAFAYTPFSNGPSEPLWHDAASYTEGSIQDRIWKYGSDRPQRCPHCDTRDACGSDNGPWHLLLECPHEDLASLRRDMVASAPGLITRLAEGIRRAHQQANRDVPDDATPAQIEELRLLADSTAWTSADGKHVLYHLLTALPWPASVATARTPLSAKLGRLFDRTVLQRRFRRKIADTVIRWAAHWIKAFAATRWRLLTESHAYTSIASL